MSNETTPTYAQISTLLQNSAYNPTIVKDLESYVKAEASSLLATSTSATTTPYYFDANRTLIKLYQFFPHLANESYIALIFLLSLLECPSSSTDFLAISFLVSDKVQSRELCASVISCAELLDSCKFAKFWQAFRRIGVVVPSTTETSTDTATPPTPPFPPSFLTSVVSSPKSINKVRSSILKLLSLSFQSAPTSTVVLPALDIMTKETFDAFLRDCKETKKIVCKVNPESVEFVPTEDNTKKVEVSKEGIQFDTIASLMMKASQ